MTDWEVLEYIVMARKRKDEWTERSGWVYFLEGPDAMWKIGRSNDPISRTSMIALLVPFETRLRFAIPYQDCYWHEKNVHTAFAKLRIRGEWFKMTEKAIKAVQQVHNQTIADWLEDHFPINPS